MNTLRKNKGVEPAKPEGSTHQGEHARTDQDRVLSWSAPETNSRKKSNDWYFILWTIAIAGAVVATMLENVLFGLLILISTFTISIYASRKPKDVTFTVSRRGVTADSLLLPFNSLSYFAISEEQEPVYLLLQSNKMLAPLNSFPVSPEVNTDELREFLLSFLEEGEIQVPAHQRIMDRIGF